MERRTAQRSAGARGRLAVAAAALHCGAALLPGGPAARADVAPVRTIASLEVMVPPGAAGYRPVFSEKKLREGLRGFVGRPCEPARIEESVARRYRALGYVPSVEADCDGGALRVSIRESSHRIELVTFDVSDLPRIGAVPARDFEETRKIYPVPQGGPRALLLGLLETREGDLYNYERYRSDREALGRLGYTVAFIAGAPKDPGDYIPGAYLIMSLSPPREERAYHATENNYLGGTGSYAPRAGTAVGLLYQKDQVFGRFDRLTITPSYNASFGGDISYRSPVVAARESPRRLYDLVLDLYSSFLHNRSLDGFDTDERRSGVGVSIGIRPLRFPAPHELRLEIGVRHERVDLSPVPPSQSEESLTILHLGATHDWRHTFRWPSLTARLAPSVDLASGRAGGQSSFSRSGLDATMHGRAGSGFETDLHFQGGTIDRRVVASELWSLGGPTTVRGFREDSFLGRHLAALQAELWIPFIRGAQAGPPRPLTEPSGEEAAPRFEPRAARLIKAALFVDGGYVAGTDLGGNQAILGAGLGVRFVVPHQPLVFRLDYGWRLAGRGGGSFPYISLAYRF